MMDDQIWLLLAGDGPIMMLLDARKKSMLVMIEIKTERQNTFDSL